VKREKATIWSRRQMQIELSVIQDINEMIPIVTSMVLDGIKKKQKQNWMKFSTRIRKACLIHCW
jgi:hypothetical protein